jgi:alkylation response protein AidB-like acyl-CoA dehydrogenase
MFTTNAPAADLFMVTSRTHDQQLLIAFVRRDTEGLEVRDSWDAMGMRASASGELVLDGCFVPTAMTASTNNHAPTAEDRPKIK